MTYSFASFDKAASETTAWLVKELSAVRTGRATPTLLDPVRVESYGTRMPLSQVATVSVEDACTVRIAPWDKNELKSIERAITEANLGISVIVDDKGVRAMFPELTGERRTELVKLAKEKLEEARVSLRKHRDHTVRDIETKEKEGALSKDEKFKTKEDLQKKVDAVNKALEELFKKKEKEIEV